MKYRNCNIHAEFVLIYAYSILLHLFIIVCSIIYIFLKKMQMLFHTPYTFKNQRQDVKHFVRKQRTRSCKILQSSKKLLSRWGDVLIENDVWWFVVVVISQNLFSHIAGTYMRSSTEWLLDPSLTKLGKRCVWNGVHKASARSHDEITHTALYGRVRPG